MPVTPWKLTVPTTLISPVVDVERSQGPLKLYRDLPAGGPDDGCAAAEGRW
jgi:hypothetical protein